MQLQAVWEFSTGSGKEGLYPKCIFSKKMQGYGLGAFSVKVDTTLYPEASQEVPAKPQSRN